jgi:hypothetical protein
LREFPEDQIGVSIARPLSARLDLLVARAAEAGEKTSRKELVGMLILGAPDDGEVLRELIGHYRRATLEEAKVAGSDLDVLLEAPPRTPGPRPRG